MTKKKAPKKVSEKNDGQSVPTEEEGRTAKNEAEKTTKTATHSSLKTAGQGEGKATKKEGNIRGGTVRKEKRGFDSCT